MEPILGKKKEGKDQVVSYHPMGADLKQMNTDMNNFKLWQEF